MSNTELCRHYMSMNAQTTLMPETAYCDIIPALDKHFNNQWTWELSDERFAMDNSTVCTTVTVYIPGRVLTGRSLCKIKDYHENHLYAILDACSTFIDKSKVIQPQQNTNQNTQQMTPEQIMEAMNQSNQPAPVNSASQFYNYKENGMPADGVPFDQITDNCDKELQQEMGMGSQPATQQNPNPQLPQQNNTMQSNDPDYDKPQEKYKGFSQRQMDRINKFKTDFEILNPTMFDNYVNTWDNRLSSKKDLNPTNVNSFLDWTDNLGKQVC